MRLPLPSLGRLKLRINFSLSFFLVCIQNSDMDASGLDSGIELDCMYSRGNIVCYDNFYGRECALFGERHYQTNMESVHFYRNYVADNC